MGSLCQGDTRTTLLKTNEKVIFGIKRGEGLIKGKVTPILRNNLGVPYTKRGGGSSVP